MPQCVRVRWPGRSELFKMTVRATNNGFKALARKGTAGQEVFISTTTMEMEDVKASERARMRTS